MNGCIYFLLIHFVIKCSTLHAIISAFSPDYRFEIGNMKRNPSLSTGADNKILMLMTVTFGKE